MQHLSPLIVTAALDGGSAGILQALRDRNFPADRNIVPVHVTLFHHLPGSEQRSIIGELRAVAASMRPFPFTTATPRFLGRGCALPLVAESLVDLRAELARRWSAWLTPQDRQPFKPHVTVQNKVDPSVARALCAALAGTIVEGRILGLNLWVYQGGPWALSCRVPFPTEATSG